MGGAGIYMWDVLRNEILTQKHLSKMKLIEVFQRVIAKSRKLRGDEFITKYPIFEFIMREDIENYIVEDAPRNDDFDSIKSTFLRVKPTSDSSKLSLIAGMLRGVVEYVTNIDCPRCSDDYLVAMVDENKHELILACNTCGWVQKLSGEEYIDERCFLSIADKIILSKYGFINLKKSVHSANY